MDKSRVKFITQVDNNLLIELRALAHDEDCQLQALVDEALADLIEKRRNSKARLHVLNAYQASYDRFGRLCKKLAQ